MTLEDRTCLVTGASRGIGRGIARRLGAEGANVAVNYRSSADAAEEVAAEISDGPGDGEGVAVQADVTDYDAVGAMHEAVRERLGPVDVLVNNAGVTNDTTFRRMSREDWLQVVDVHLNGMFNATHACFDDIEASDAGRLINVSSVVGKQGNFGQANYAAAKSGMFGFTRTIALELASSGSTANCIAPGFTMTDMLRSVDDDRLEAIREGIPLGRFADPDEVAGLVRYLASEEGAYITGEVIDITGGMDL